MLPQGLVLVREIGNTEAPYWTAASHDGVLQKAKVIDEPLARWLVSTVATHRMALLPPGSPDAGTLHGYKAAGGGAINGANPGDLRWPLPGATAELIASVIAQREGTSRATQ